MIPSILDREVCYKYTLCSYDRETDCGRGGGVHIGTLEGHDIKAHLS